MKLLAPELEASVSEGVKLFGKWDTQEVEVKDMCANSLSKRHTQPSTENTYTTNDCRVI